MDATIEDEGCNLTVGEIVTILSYALAIKLPMNYGRARKPLFAGTFCRVPYSDRR